MIKRYLSPIAQVITIYVSNLKYLTVMGCNDYIECQKTD